MARSGDQPVSPSSTHEMQKWSSTQKQHTRIKHTQNTHTHQTHTHKHTHTHTKHTKTQKTKTHKTHKTHNTKTHKKTKTHKTHKKKDTHRDTQRDTQTHRQCEGGGNVVGVVTPLVGGVAQAFHDDPIVELRVQLGAQEVEGKEEDREGQVEVERVRRVKEVRPWI